MRNEETERIKTSVCMITYNHEKFIESAIRSVLTQTTNFKFELVIGDDCSCDKTLQICLEMQKQYPTIIRVLRRNQNLGMLHNFVDTLKSCSGEYIALLEGDDFWVSPNKLQIQSDFLDQNQDFASCFTGTVAFFDETGQTAYHIPLIEFQKSEITIKDLLKRNSIATCSVMFRKKYISIFPEWYYSLPIGDWPIHILLSEKGRIGYINVDAANYRIHQGSYYSSKGIIKILINDVTFYRVIDKYLNYKYHNFIQLKIIRKLLGISKQYFRQLWVFGRV